MQIGSWWREHGPRPRTKSTHANTAFPAIGTILIHQRANNFVCIWSRKCGGQRWFGWHDWRIRADDWHDNFGLLWQSANYTEAEEGAVGAAGAAIAAGAAGGTGATGAAVVAVVAVAAVAAVAAAGAGSRLSTDGCKQNERSATISSNQKLGWELWSSQNWNGFRFRALW